ncbi:class I SAM-dependent methyltransferase [Psychrobacter raelei]|uniref:Ribosomal RNA small subunit methyltransferase J n=1 Tax=Psychrobacter raelei TaxID=2565531 RepID=A0AAT9PFG1_9GAMM|nr:class I SAM-dependent methyltransferase [Psychrobacter sp. PraFG1]UNK05896.1 class I SAM-dependent methyltransferase [Psychrobacter sp. PraFG1]
MTSPISCVTLIYPQSIAEQALILIQALQQLIVEAKLPLSIEAVASEQKLTQKIRKQLSQQYQQPLLVIDDKQQLTLLTNGVSVSPEWNSLQRRVVSAGRKSELLLQATKLTASSRVLDATAGFGHDSLILASSGAQLTLLERNPLMVLLLKYEQQMMAKQPNWQKLMARLHIVCAESTEYMQPAPTACDLQAQTISHAFDVIYLDPMFPESSYAHSSKGAKVGKHMQALHQIAEPPSLKEEQALLSLALSFVAPGGRVVVKRPIQAPVFASQAANESWQNDVVRFDAYFTYL